MRWLLDLERIQGRKASLQTQLTLTWEEMEKTYQDKSHSVDLASKHSDLEQKNRLWKCDSAVKRGSLNTYVIEKAGWSHDGVKEHDSFVNKCLKRKLKAHQNQGCHDSNVSNLKWGHDRNYGWGVRRENPVDPDTWLSLPGGAQVGGKGWHFLLHGLVASHGSEINICIIMTL